jgi:DNA-binding MarR family transcriptional regulator
VHRARTHPPAERSAAGVADRLHSASIHLLRKLRQEDAAAGITAPRLSALSVVVFAGPLSLGDLATAEQVKPPTMTRLVAALERAKLVRRETAKHDARVVVISATAKGVALLQQGRERRIARLQMALAALPDAELDRLGRAVATLEEVISSL